MELLYELCLLYLDSLDFINVVHLTILWDVYLHEHRIVVDVIRIFATAIFTSTLIDAYFLVKEKHKWHIVSVLHSFLRAYGDCVCFCFKSSD